MAVQLKTLPYWIDSETLPRFGPLSRNERADVVVVGGGITGLPGANAAREIARDFKAGKV